MGNTLFLDSYVSALYVIHLGLAFGGRVFWLTWKEIPEPIEKAFFSPRSLSRRQNPDDPRAW